VSHPLKDTGLVLQREYSVFEISSVSISRWEGGEIPTYSNTLERSTLSYRKSEVTQFREKIKNKIVIIPMKF
jgi:hypothetical protein